MPFGLYSCVNAFGCQRLPKPIVIGLTSNEVLKGFTSDLWSDSELGNRIDFERLQGVPETRVRFIKRILGVFGISLIWIIVINGLGEDLKVGTIGFIVKGCGDGMA